MKPLFRVFALLAATIWLIWRWHRSILRYAMNLSAVAHRVKRHTDISIPMPDGAILFADHYLPRSSGEYPTILIRSPYGRSTRQSTFGMVLEFSAHRFAERGYHVIVQDVRGRFDSQGEFTPFINEHDDGLSTIQWITQQDWYNGKLGMWGGSYLGLVQWAIAADSPHISALVPSITGSSLRDVIFPDDAIDLGLMMRWLTLLKLLHDYESKSLLTASPILLKAESVIAPTFTQLPVGELDRQIAGEPLAFYQDWLERESADNVFWSELRKASDVSQVNVPAHLISGWYDFFLRPLLIDYAQLKAAGASPYLTIGPWHHFSEIGSMTDLSHGLTWFDAHLKGDASRLRQKPVRIYVMETDEWREFEDWPPPAHTRPYYLHANGHLMTIPSNEEQSATHYCYDPTDPTPAVGGTQFGFGGGKRDNRILEARNDVITFSSDPLSTPLEIIGPVTATLYVRSSNEYTDFFARLCDVHSSGQSFNVCDGLFRITPGKSRCNRGDCQEVEIDMWATAWRFLPGHRLRLIVSSGAHPRWNRNPGTGDATIIASRLIPAQQTVFHDRNHFSQISLPIFTMN